MIARARIGGARRPFPASGLAAGRREARVPALSALVLARHARRPAPVIATTRIELHVAPVGAALAGPRGARGDAGAPGAGAPAASIATTRELLRERVEHIVERLQARGRREEPRPAALRTAISETAAVASPAQPPAFPELVLAPRPDAPAPADPATGPTGDSRSVSPAPSAPLAAVPVAPVAASEVPRLVDQIIGELDRRTASQRERRGLIA